MRCLRQDGKKVRERERENNNNNSNITFISSYISLEQHQQATMSEMTTTNTNWISKKSCLNLAFFLFFFAIKLNRKTKEINILNLLRSRNRVIKYTCFQFRQTR